MLDLVKVAVTGGLASGKSTFCRELQKLGAYYISADQILHKLLEQDLTIAKALRELLGDEIIVDEGINRGKIADIVFESQELLKQVEAILHPAIQAKIQEIYEESYKLIAKTVQKALFVVEVPLLFEACMEKWYDFVIAIVAIDSIACARYELKTGHLPKEYERRMQHQLAPADKAKRADYIVENNHTLEEFQEKAKALFKSLINYNNNKE